MADKSLDLRLLGEWELLSQFPWIDGEKTIPLSAPIYSVREQFELSGRIPESEVFWSPHYNIPLGYIRARRRVVTICDVYHLAYFHTLSLRQKLYAKLFLKAAIALSDRVVTISEFSADEIKSRLGRVGDKLQVISCGCDPTFSEGASPRIGESDYVLYVGNVKPHKNIRGALRAFLEISPKHPDLRFVIVGRKEGFITGDEEVSALVSRSGNERVQFTGHVGEADLKSYYQHARMLVFPSFYEGFGLPLLEAMKFGVPIISSDRASLPEVGGDAVLYFNPADPLEIAARMEEVLQRRWMPDTDKYAERLGKFDWDDAANRYISLFKAL